MLLDLLSALMLTVPVAAAAIPVELVQHDGEWQLLRGGKPWEVKGAAGGGSLADLAAAGANTTAEIGGERVKNVHRLCPAIDVYGINSYAGVASRLTAKDGWGGVAWQDPPNDWGALPAGLDLRGASRLSFRARGEKGGESVKFGLGLIGRDPKYPDTARVESGEVTLSQKWRHFVVDLEGADLERVKTGFDWVAAAPVTFYLDSVRIE